MIVKDRIHRDQLEIFSIENFVPADHLLRIIDSAVDFIHIYDLVEDLYCKDNGRPSVDPVVIFKIVLIQHIYGIPSLRRTVEEIKMNVAYRWFLGYLMNEEIPHFSTISYDFKHRYTEKTIEGIFYWILNEIEEAGYLSPETVFIDGTHIKANANIKKVVKKAVPQAAKRYEEELMAEINQDREGYREFKSKGYICKKCPTKHLCTENQKNEKTVTKHIWLDYLETVEDIRYTPEYKELYERRKETIERVFADAKEKHAMQYTPYRGLSQVTNWVRLKFAAMNLKEYAIHRLNRTHKSTLYKRFLTLFLPLNVKALNLA